jgi:hypothetical protein
MAERPQKSESSGGIVLNLDRAIDLAIGKEGSPARQNFLPVQSGSGDRAVAGELDGESLHIQLHLFVELF